MVRASAGGIIVRSDGRLVLVEQHGNSWSFPKGGVEEGESELDAALREIQEETGLTDLALVAPLGSYTRYSLARDGKTEDTAMGLRPRTFFLFRAGSDALAPEDREVTRAEWVTFEEALLRLTHPKDKEFLRSVEDKVRSALQ